jgi:hypothetical protein
MRRYLKFSTVGDPGSVYQIDIAGNFLLSIDDIVAPAEYSGSGPDVKLLLTSPNGSPPDSGTAIVMRCTVNTPPAGQVVTNAIVEAITSAPGGNVDLNTFLPEGYNILSWQYETYIV